MTNHNRNGVIIPDDPYMIPDLKRLIRNGSLTPLDQTEGCISGRRYPSANWRGLNEWTPRDGGRAELLGKIQIILEEYKDYLPMSR